MQAPTFPPCINLAHLKSQIDKNVGPEKAQHYFSYLNRFLNQKLSKSRFNKLCSIILGPENIHLHNQLILSILKNAYLAKTPLLPCNGKNLVKHVGEAGNKSPIAENRFRASQPTSSTAAIWSNGDILPRSSQQSITDYQNTRFKDKFISVRRNGKSDILVHDSLLPFDSTARENGGLTPCDLRGHLQQQTHIAEQPTKRQRINKLLQHDQVTRHSEGLPYGVPIEEQRELEPITNLSSSRGSLRAPLGIPFCPASVGGACRPLPLASGSSSRFSLDSRNAELCHTEVLKKIMEEIAKAHGVSGVTIDSANLLNKGLDVYLKRLIKSCVELAGSRSGLESRRQMAFKQQLNGKIINGIRPVNQVRVHSSESVDGSQDPNILRTASLLDLKVAMELNPYKLGDDWSLLLGKIYNCSFEE